MLNYLEITLAARQWKSVACFVFFQSTESLQTGKVPDAAVTPETF